VLYGLGAAVYVGLLMGGVLQRHGRSGFGALGYIGLAQPISFAGYGLALTVCGLLPAPDPPGAGRTPANARGGLAGPEPANCT
jgi:hypothetical protein